MQEREAVLTAMTITTFATNTVTAAGIETDQGPFVLKVTPTKAHFRSGTEVGRC